MIAIRFVMRLRSCCTFIVLALLLVLGAYAQLERPEANEPKLPNGKSQRVEILKAEHEKSLKDASELVKLSEDLQIELEKNEHMVVSVTMLKKLEEIEKRAKRIRSRLTRY